MRICPATLILVAHIGGVPATALAAPRPKELPKPVLYYPTTVGEQWVLGLDLEDGTTVAPVVVVSAAEKGGVTTVAVANVNKDGTHTAGFTVEVSDKGVCVVANPRGKVDPPHWQVKLPAKAGTQWEVPVTGRDGKPGVMVRTVAGEEEVATPAGTFRAVRVAVEYPAGTPWVTEWWAPGRGKVKQSSPGAAYPLVLKSVTPAKK
jgi:hypothetical protein